MGQPIEISRIELSASALRALAGKTEDGAVVRRLLAIALAVEGCCRDTAALLNGLTRQTLHDWVHRHNAEGVAGLRSRTGPGRPPFRTDARMDELREMVLKGPAPERHTVVRWRCADLCQEIAERWSVNPTENVWDYLRGNELSHRLWDTCDAIVQACADAWRFLIGDPERIRSIATRRWACVNV